MQKGISYAVFWGAGEYSKPDTDLSVANLAATGANWMSLNAIGNQETITSTTIFTTATGSPTDADLIHAIRQGHNLGLKVMLRFGVGLLNDPTHWPGQIGENFTTEAEWASWFASYRHLIEYYADLAETHGVDQFSVGTELGATVHRADDWRAVIAAARSRYSGPITYSANHSGEETSITWWDAVDYIGVDAYYPLTDKNDPTLDELRAAWVPHVATLANLASTWGKPILFTEIGYRSLDGANRYPWEYQPGGTIDLQEQADAYQATFESVYSQPWFAGMFWHFWATDPFKGGPCDDDFTPHDKPAEDVLRAWYGAPPRPTPTPTPQPTSTPTTTPSFTPSATPPSTPQPTPQSTPPPMPTPTLAYPYPAPALLAPADGQVFQGTDQAIVLTWASVGILAQDEWYVVRLRYEAEGMDQPPNAWTKTTSWRVPAEVYPSSDVASRLLRWDVTVKRQTHTGPDGAPEGVDMSPVSSTRSFYWY